MLDEKYIKKYGIDTGNLINSVLKIKHFPHALLKEVFAEGAKINYSEKYDGKYILEWYYDHLLKSNAVAMSNSVDNLIYILNKTGDINHIFLRNLLDNVEVLKKTYETYNISEKMNQLYDNVINKCMKPGFYNYLLNKFKLCTIYERSLYYLKKLLLFKKKYSDLYDSVKIKLTKFDTPVYELYCIYNYILLNIKSNHSELEELLLTINKADISKYLFLSDNNDITDAEKGLRFVRKLGYKRKVFTEIENMKLKRGFIIGLENDNNEFIFKYQPNKSITEIVINTYLKMKGLKSVLLPEIFYLNSDNSYFSIIQKYDTDLHKYFNVLEKRGKLMTLETIIKIVYAFILSIKEFQENNLIHTDLKLENTVLNLDSQGLIIDMKIIDFDLSVFAEKPEFEIKFPGFKKTLMSKRNRGTKTYMKNCDDITFHNDIYSLGIVIIILLYKTARLIISGYRIYSSTLEHDTKYIIKNRNINKEMQRLREKISEGDNKRELLNLCCDFFLKLEKLKFNKGNSQFFENNKEKLFLLKKFVGDCFDEKNKIEDLNDKYKELFAF